MKKSSLYLLMLCLLLFSAGCQAAPAAPVVEAPAPTQAAAAPTEPAPTATVVDSKPALTLVSEKETKELTLDQIKSLPAVEGQSGIKSSTGAITLPTLFKGVLISDLLKEVGGADSSMSLQVEAEDGYAITFSVDQINKGDFITYDPGTGDETKSGGKLQVILAYEMDGKPLDAQRDGQLRLAVISEKNNQVVDGHWAVKWINKIRIKPLEAEWTLHLEGALTEDMDRATFQSGAAEKCHKASWTDGKAQEWVGIPLWLMVGRVDDEIKHDGPAFNDALADAGYTVDVIAADGFKAEFSSADIKRNNDIIVAYMVNGNPLTDQDFPLKLVGPNLTGKQMVGNITQIVMHMDGKAAVEPTAAPTAEPAPTSAPAAAPAVEGAALTIEGLVAAPQAWTLDDLKKLDVTKMSVEHPKKGKMDVEGVRFSVLLGLAQPKPEAKTLVFTASDGYVSQMDYKMLTGCKDCLAAFNADGGLDAAMPGLESNFWAKSIVKMEIK